MLSNIDGTNEEVLATRKDGDKWSVHGLAWSPDGNTVICPENRWKPKFHTNLVAFDINNKSEKVIGGPSWFQILQVGWLEDMKSLVISARENNSSPFRLWQIQWPDGTAQLLTSDLDDFQGVSISDGKIVTIKTSQSWRLWISTPGDLQQATVITSGVGSPLWSCLDQPRKNRLFVDGQGQAKHLEH